MLVVMYERGKKISVKRPTTVHNVKWPLSATQIQTQMELWNDVALLDGKNGAL